MTLAVPSLVVITDRRSAGRAARTVEATVRATLDGGAPAVLLRDKELDVGERTRLGERLRELTTAAGARLLVASDPTLAHHLGADGLHLAAADPPYDGPVGLLGRSCHDRAEVAAARGEGVAYAFVSPVAVSASKPGHGPPLGPAGLARLLGAADGVPLLALGGVSRANAAIWRHAGAAGLAVMGSVMAAPDPAAAVRELLTAWDRPPAPAPTSTSVRQERP